MILFNKLLARKKLYSSLITLANRKRNKIEKTGSISIFSISLENLIYRRLQEKKHYIDFEETLIEFMIYTFLSN